MPLFTPPSAASDAEVRPKNRAGLLTILFTDIVGSTQFKQQFGDAEAVRLIQMHHDLVRRILAEFQDAREIETAGDSFLLIFERPSDAVRFSVKLQREIEMVFVANGKKIFDRIGIHLGEVLVHEATSKLFGMQVDAAARIMSLAHGGQILLSRLAFDTARQMLRGPGEGHGDLQWLNHGPYVFKGIDEPIEVCEVRSTRAKEPAIPPANSDKAHRMAVDGEIVLGWRPAAGQTVPNSKWVLAEKIGEGAFGEVWLGRHAVLKQEHVFKFCFRADRVRSLKREVTFFRMLKERVGDHPNIVIIHEMCLESPPFYVEMDFVPGRDLRTWCGSQGGAEKVSLADKLEIITQAADALQAAHECGIIHRDVKPGNLLISGSETRRGNRSEDGKCAAKDRTLRCKLSDFGIGQIFAEEYFGEITRFGFTQTIISDSSQSGTQIYMAPELMAGKPASIRSDIYSLGVVLYQLLTGNLDQPLTTDWSSGIEDPLLREDLRRCFAGRPEERFSSAAELAKSLRALEARHTALEREKAEQAARERAAYRRGMIRTAAISTVILLAMAALAVVAVHKSALAKNAAGIAQAKTVEAQQNADESRRRLQRLNIATGIQRMNEGDLLNALPWFVEGLRLIRNDPVSERISRIRIGTLFNQAPRLLKVWESTEGADTGVISPDGHRLLVITGGATTPIWDLQSGAEVCPALKHDSLVAGGEFTPDGSLVLTWFRETVASPGSSTNLSVWDAKTGKLLFKLPHHSAVRSAAFSPDGKRIATGSADGQVALWETSSGQRLFATDPRQGSAVLRVIFNARKDRKDQLITASENGRVFVRGIKDGTPLFPPLEHGGGLTMAECSLDGELIATSSGFGAVLVWSTETGQRIGTPINQSSFQLLSIAFSPDSRHLVTCGFDRTARVWDARTGNPVTQSLPHEHTVNKARFGPDAGTVLTACFDGKARLWDAMTGKLLIPSLPHSAAVLDAKFLPNGHQILTFSKDHLVKLWDIAVAVPAIPPMSHPPGSELDVVKFSPDGTRILTGSSDGTLALWDAGSGQRVREWQLSRDVTWADFSRDGKWIVSACQNGKVQVWMAATGERVGPELVHAKAVRFAALNRDGSRVLTASDDGTAVLWNRADGKPKFTFRHSAEVNWAQFSPDEMQIATASADQSARVWDSHTGKPVTAPLKHERAVIRVAFSPDGKKVIAAESDSSYAPCHAQVWTIATGKPEGPPLHHADGVLTAVYSGDGRYIATSSEDATASLWNAETFKPVAPPLKHQHQVHFIEFDASNELVLTGSSDYTARVWDLTGEPVTPPLMHFSRVFCGGWDRTGLRFVTGVRINCAHIWNLVEERRNLDTLAWHAEAVSGIHIDPLSGPTALTSSELMDRWKRLGRSVSEPIPPSQVASWHRLRTTNYRFSDRPGSELFHLDQALQIQGQDPTLYWERSVAEHSLKNWNAALSEINKAIALEPANPSFHEQRGHLYSFHFRDRPRATEDLRLGHSQWLSILTEKTAKEPENAGPFSDRASLYVRLKMFSEAAADFARAIELSKTAAQKAGLFVQAGDAEWENGSPEKAKESFEAAAKLDAASSTPGERLCRLLLLGPDSLRNVEAALKLARQALEREPMNETIQFLIGIGAYRKGEYQSAAERFQRVSAANENAGLSHFFRAMCHARLGQPATARDEYREGLSWMRDQWDIPWLLFDQVKAAQTEAQGLVAPKGA